MAMAATNDWHQPIRMSVKKPKCQRLKSCSRNDRWVKATVTICDVAASDGDHRVMALCSCDGGGDDGATNRDGSVNDEWATWTNGVAVN